MRTNKELLSILRTDWSDEKTLLVAPSEETRISFCDQRIRLAA